MSDTYTKVFSSITESTVWGEPYATRVVWVTMLAMADARGNVYGAIPGLARRANVTLEEAEKALAAFLSPDPYSRTKDHDGRRIAEIDGGWRLVNHAKYSTIRNAEERREYKREWDRKHRSKSAMEKSDNPTKSDSNPTNPTDSATPTPALTLEEQEQTSLERQAARLSARFDDFWRVYPNKKGKAKAQAAWKRKRLDAIADRIIADVKARMAGDRQWLEGFIPHGSTYVNGEGWQDAIEPPKTNGRMAGTSGYQPLPGEI